MDDGATSLTTIETVAVSLPAVLVAVMVYVVWEDTAVGVPPMVPVVVPMERPAGSEGEME